MMQTSFNSATNLMSQIKLDQIKQVQTNFDISVQQFEYAFSAYSTTPSFTKLVSNPLTYNDFVEFKAADSQLNYLGTITLEGANLSLISLDGNWKIENDSLYQLTTQDREALLDQYVRSDNNGFHWIKEGNSIKFIITLPIANPVKNSLIVAEIGAHSMDKLISGDSNEQIFILNKEGEIVYNTDYFTLELSSSEIDTLIQKDSIKKENMLQTLPNSNEKVVCNFSSYNGWEYCMVLNNSEIVAMALPNIYLYLFIGLFLIVIVVGFAYIVAKYYSRKINLLSDILLIDKNTDINELDQLSESITRLMSEQVLLKETLQDELPQLESQFILNLYHSKMMPKEIEAKMEQFGYMGYVDNSYFATMLIQIDDMGHHREAEKDLMLAVVKRIVMETIPSQYRMKPVIINDTTLATILMFKDEERANVKKQISTYAQDTIDNARQFVKLSISVGVSDLFKNMNEMRGAIQMAKQALRHRISIGKEIVIFFEDIATKSNYNSLIHYPKLQEDTLMDAISLGDEEMSLEVAQKFIDEVKTQDLDPSAFQMIMMRVTNNLISYQNQLGISQQLYDSNKQAYKVILESYNIEEIIKAIQYKFIVPMVALVRIKNEEQFRNLSQDIVNIIQEKFNEDISLEIIADELHYNPNYLSRIFKRELGMSFSEYLINYRVEIAKKYLVESDMSIKEISEELKYSNSQNFIRTFRKKVDMTPGAFRKEYSHDG